MMKQIRNLGVIALLAVAIVGCSDSLTDAGDQELVAGYDAYDATLLDETLLTAYGEVPGIEQALLADSTGADSALCDSLRGGERPGKGHGRDGRRGGRPGHSRGDDGGIGDIAPLGIRNYRTAAARLGLSGEQDALFRTAITDLRECAGDAATAYRTAREAAFAPYKSAVDAIREAVEAGTMTREEAKPQLDSIRTAFETAIAPLNEELRAAVAACRSTFEASVEAMLTAEQLALWGTLKG